MNQSGTKVKEQGSTDSRSGRRYLSCVCLAVAVLAAEARSVAAQQPEGILRLEEAYFNDAIVTFLLQQQQQRFQRNNRKGEFS